MYFKQRTLDIEKIWVVLHVIYQSQNPTVVNYLQPVFSPYNTTATVTPVQKSKLHCFRTLKGDYSAVVLEHFQVFAH
jgi:hypothetical protein